MKMKLTFLSIVLALLAGTDLRAQELFFSEYIEGSSNNKALEIYNPNWCPVDLSQYKVKTIMNGGTGVTPFYEFVFPQGKILNAHEVYVITHSLANPIIKSSADTTFNGSVVNFNGDDSPTLQKLVISGASAVWVIIDVINNPNGATDTVAGIPAATINHTLVRKSTVCGPNANWEASAGTNSTNSEWIVYPQDTSMYLGAHVSVCTPLYDTDILAFSLAQQTGPAVINNALNRVQVEVAPGTNLASLIPTFTLSTCAEAFDPSYNQILSGVTTGNYSDTVNWFITNYEVQDEWEIIVKAASAAYDTAKMVINEVDYDNPGSGDPAEFIELKNNDNVAINLNKMILELVNGSNNTNYATIILPDFNLLPGDYFVICGSGANVPNCDLDVTPNSDLIQNGAPDAMVLKDSNGIVLDKLSYEGNVSGYEETSGVGLTDLAARDYGISRIPDGVDTDVNNLDFKGRCITPGEANINDTLPCACTIYNIVKVSVDTCVPATNTFSAVVTVSYDLAPDSGSLQVNGQNFAITASPQTVTLTGLPSNGQLQNVTASFTADAMCTFTVNNLLQAPPSCASCNPNIRLVINEVDYDQTGTDSSEFLELRNNGTSAVNLENFQVLLINGSGGATYVTITLPNFLLAVGDYYVICANNAKTPNCDLDITPNVDLIQNGAPDAIAVRNPCGLILDKLSYEGSVLNYVEGSGTTVNDNSSLVGHGVSRYPDGQDTDNNNADFLFKCITPGEANTELTGYCGPFFSFLGVAQYANTVNTVLPDVEVTLDGQGNPYFDRDTTNGSGYFGFDNVPLGQFLLTGSADFPWVLGASNATDALKVLAHSVGLANLSGIYFKAGDVNGDKALNAVDALQICQRFAGQIPSFNIDEWVFGDINLTINLNKEALLATMKGLIAGDVNGSHTPSFTKSSPSNALVFNGELTVRTGSIIQFPVSFDRDITLGALSLVFDIPQGMSVRKVSIPEYMGSSVYSIQNGQVRVALFNQQGISLAAGQPLMNLEVEATGPQLGIQLGFETEVADQDGRIIEDAAFVLPKLVNAGNHAGYSISNYPNPFSNRTTITYETPVPGMITIKVFNILGEEVSVLVNEYKAAGRYEVLLDAASLPDGSYIYKLSGIDAVVTGKLILSR